jgi:peptidoglycan/LPS O-acetylase OafA/YrhL
MSATTIQPAAASFPANLKEGLSHPQLPGLDGLRAFAAYFVLVYHFGYEFIPGGLGVLAFYVLSGFLITWLMLKEQEKTTTVSLRGFYIRRSLRIFPAFYAYWALVIGGKLYFERAINWPQAIAAFFYVNNYYQAINGHFTSGFSHTWSLGVEEQFYLIWPATFLLLSRARWGVARWLAGLIVFFWVYRAVLQFWVQVPEVYIYEAFDARADHLLVGCLLAVLIRKGLASRLWQVVCSHPACTLITLALLTISVVAANRTGQVEYRNSVGFLIDPLLIAILIVQLIAFWRTWWWGWMNWAWLRYLGRISYSVYLYQQLVPPSVRRALAGYPNLIQLLATAVVVTAAASLSYFLIERPFLRLKDRFASPGDPRRGGSPSPVLDS